MINHKVVEKYTIIWKYNGFVGILTKMASGATKLPHFGQTFTINRECYGDAETSPLSRG
jgi:hypothetical protein